MMSLKKLMTAVGFSFAVAMTTVPSHAQQMYMNDTWSHVSTPGQNGQCWHSTDPASDGRAFGYWGDCPNASAPRAQAVRPQARRNARVGRPPQYR